VNTKSSFMLFSAGWMMLMTAHAVPITYHMALVVNEVLGERAPGSPPLPSLFFPVPSIGDVFHGHFILDDGILATDGLKGPVAMDAFRLDIAGVIWDKNLPSELAGFRGPVLGSISPQFLVAGGAVSGIAGGPYGRGDAPFVDFFQGGDWASRDGGMVFLKGTYSLGSSGTEAVPEPATAILMLLGLAAVAVSGRKRNFIAGLPIGSQNPR
jgi:hypothetical protein